MVKEEFFYDSVMSCIREHQLVGPDDKILVALSGGADSVALLLVLQQAGFHCEAVHCNFHLRGEESDRFMPFTVHTFAYERFRHGGVRPSKRYQHRNGRT